MWWREQLKIEKLETLYLQSPSSPDIYDLFDIHESIDKLVTNILILWLKMRVVRWLAKVTLRWKGRELEAILCPVLSGTHCSRQVHRWPCLKLLYP